MVDPVTVTPVFGGQHPASDVPGLGVNSHAQLNGLERNAYASYSLSYPIDLENQAHLVQFDIYVPSSAGGGKFTTSGSGTVFASPFGSTSIVNNVTQQGSLGLPNLASKVGLDASLLQTNNGQSAAQQQNSTLTGSQKIDASIQLYMPEQMTFDHQAKWADMDTVPLLAQAGSQYGGLLAGLGITAGLASGNPFTAALGGAAALVGGAAAVYGTAVSALTQDLGKAVLYARGGYAFNPIVQVIYSGPSLRQFQFDWNFAPRNKSEADAIKQIIKTFRMYASPDYSSLNLGILGGLFIPPATFDITFFRNDGSGFSENTNIQRISRCALTQISTNYNPDGVWQSFEDGNPVHIFFQMFFQELQIITHDLVNQGF